MPILLTTLRLRDPNTASTTLLVLRLLRDILNFINLMMQNKVSCDGRAIARPRGATPHPRSGAEAGRTPCPKGGGQEELPHVRGQGQRPRVPGCDRAGTAERSYPTSEARGGGRDELPHFQGAVATRAQEGLVELFHVQGPEGQQ